MQVLSASAGHTCVTMRNLVLLHERRCNVAEACRGAGEAVAVSVDNGSDTTFILTRAGSLVATGSGNEVRQGSNSSAAPGPLHSTPPCRPAPLRS